MKIADAVNEGINRSRNFCGLQMNQMRILTRCLRAVWWHRLLCWSARVWDGFVRPRLTHQIADYVAGYGEADCARQPAGRNVERRSVLGKATHNAPKNNEAYAEDDKSQDTEQDSALHSREHRQYRPGASMRVASKPGRF